MAMPLHSLLDRVKAPLKQAAWPLFDVLNSEADYLNRYHCADALIKITGSLLAEGEITFLSSRTAWKP